MEGSHQLRAAGVSLAVRRLHEALAVWERERKSLRCQWLYVCARRGGKPLNTVWIAHDQDARERIERAFEHDLQSATSFELEFLHSPRQHYLRTSAREQWNALRGRYAMAIEFGGRVRRWAALEMLAANLTFRAALTRHLATLELEGALPTVIPVTLFQTKQLFCDNQRSADGQCVPVEMFRGNTVVPIAAVNPDGVRRTAHAMARWLAAQVDEGGACCYKYWPSSDRYARANNAIRQWMATICLNRVAKAFHSGPLAAIARRNLVYNLASTFRREDDVGYIWMDGTAKLGAAALAALAIFESPGRAAWRREEYALHGLIQKLSNADGSFDTFYIPRESHKNQNFYSGEALLFLATRYRVGRDPRELARIMAAFHHYRDWHRANRNPAFVPWHTQAYYLVWQITRDEAVRDFIFEMNDWLLPMQQWESAECPDMRGRFYDPARRHFGPPHASSTGVYLEGLADAFAMARECGDTARSERYRIAIVRGIRSLMQLQFKDSVDCFYVADINRVLGGLRTTEYDNSIRIDNVQHGLMALLKVLGSFGARDYAATAACDRTSPIEASESRPSWLWRSDEVLKICTVSRVFNDRPWNATEVIARKNRPAAGSIYFAKESLEEELVASREEARQPAVIFAESQTAQALATQVSCPVCEVSSVLQAARLLADAARSRARARVIGITGSLGKTSTKDALALVLAASGATYATQANANDGWGVLDTLMNLPPEARYAVIEMGMLGAGSISPKSKRIRPHVGIITNIHEAHLQYHDGPASIAATKSGLFDGMCASGVAILPRDSAWYEYLLHKARVAGVEQTLSFGMHPQADFRLMETRSGDGPSTVRGSVRGRPVEFPIGVSGKHWGLLAMSVLAAAHSVGVAVDAAALLMQSLRPSFRRGEVHRVTRDGKRWTVVDDTWNASPTSVRAALENLDTLQPDATRRVLVLGDMLELGDVAIDKHIELIDAIIAARIDVVHTAGELTQALHARLPPALRGEHSHDAGLAAQVCGRAVRSGDLILVKGSHAMQMWRVVRALRYTPAVRALQQEMERGTFSPPSEHDDRPQTNQHGRRL